MSEHQTTTCGEGHQWRETAGGTTCTVCLCVGPPASITPDALAVEGLAAQQHLHATLTEGRAWAVRWDKMRDSVKDEWRQKARAYMEAPHG